MCLNDLALVYHKLGDYVEAAELYRQALAIVKKALGPEHRFTVSISGNLGTLYCIIGDYTQAESIFKQSLELRRKTLGEDHEYTANSHNLLGGLYSEMGDYDQAEFHYRQALEIEEKVFGKDNVKTLDSLAHLAGVYSLQRQYSRAAPIFEHVLAIRSKTLDTRHEELASCLKGLGGVYKEMANYPQAATNLRESLKIYEEALGPEHMNTADTIRALGDLCRLMGNYEEAEALLRQALDIYKATLGDDHLRTAETTNQLGVFYHVLGDDAQAALLYRQALDISRRRLDFTSAIQSERQQFVMNAMLREHLDAYLSVAAKTGSSVAETYGPVLQWKGAVYRRQLQARLLRRGGDDELLPLVADLERTSRRLATLALATPTPEQRDSRQRRLEDLTEQKETLEVDLLRRSAAFRQQQAAAQLSPEELQAALPATSSPRSVSTTVALISPNRRHNRPAHSDATRSSTRWGQAHTARSTGRSIPSWTGR